VSFALLERGGPMRCESAWGRRARQVLSRLCLLLAGIVLVTARGLYRRGLVGPRTVGWALRCSSGLTEIGLLAWRQALHGNRLRRTPGQ
jgi:hypothetical protein